MGQSPRILEIAAAGKDVLAGRITSEQFLEILDRVSEELETHEENLREIVVSPQQLEAMHGGLAATFEGIALFHEGLERMSLYCDDPVAEHLEAGFELARRGSERISSVKFTE